MFYEHFDWSVPLYGVTDGLLTAAECADLLARVADAEWLPATVNGPDGRYRGSAVHVRAACRRYRLDLRIRPS